MTKLSESNAESKVIIGEVTPIRIGLVILLFGALASSIWWAATITSKLDSILSLQATTTSEVSGLKTEVSDLKLKLALDEAAIKSLQDISTLSSKK